MNESQISDIVGRVYASAGSGDGFGSMLEPFCAATGSETGIVAYIDPRADRPDGLNWGGRLEGRRRMLPISYEGEMHRTDPTMVHIARHPMARGLFDSARGLSADYLESSPYMRWMREDLELEHWLVAYTVDPTGLLFACAGHRPRGEGPHDEAEHRRFRLLFAHADHARGLAALPEGLLQDRLIVLDGAGRVIGMGADVERIVAGNAGLSVKRRRLLTTDSRMQAELDRLIALATAPIRLGGIGGTIALPRGDGRRPLVARVEPLPPQAGLAGCVGGALVRVLDPEPAVSPRRAEWRALFGFTPAEARLAEALMADDANLRATADRLGIAYATARTQAASLYGKAGVRGQVGLVRLLSRLEA